MIKKLIDMIFGKTKKQPDIFVSPYPTRNDIDLTLYEITGNKCEQVTEDDIIEIQRESLRRIEEDKKKEETLQQLIDDEADRLYTCFLSKFSEIIDVDGPRELRPRVIVGWHTVERNAVTAPGASIGHCDISTIITVHAEFVDTISCLDIIYERFSELQHTEPYSVGRLYHTLIRRIDNSDLFQSLGVTKEVRTVQHRRKRHYEELRPGVVYKYDLNRFSGDVWVGPMGRMEPYVACCTILEEVVVLWPHGDLKTNENNEDEKVSINTEDN